jgi:predicted nucleic acid-binding Zn ribbon protein
MTWRPFSPPPADREPRALRESLQRVTARLGLAAPDVLTQVFARWEELVGVDVAAHAKPRTLRDGILTVAVDHPAWASSLRLLSADLLRRIAAAAGEGVVTELVVTVDGAGARKPRKPRV